MMQRLAFAVFLLISPGLLAQIAGDAERQRIVGERRDVDQRYTSDVEACRQAFQMNACLDRARAVRRDALAELRRQEVALNDGQRRQRAAIKHAQAESSAERQAQRVRDAERRAGQRSAAKPESDDVTASGRAPGAMQPMTSRDANDASAGSSRQSSAARRANQTRERMAEAKARREANERRLARQTKPPAPGLPALRD